VGGLAKVLSCLEINFKIIFILIKLKS